MIKEARRHEGENVWGAVESAASIPLTTKDPGNGRPPCPRCDKQPQDFPTNSAPCCNEACGGTWGAGCYHCHHHSYYDDHVAIAAGARIAKGGVEAVDHPAHYGGEEDPYEAIKVIEAWSLGFHLGNVLRYINRHKRKEKPLEDLQKARWYLDREIHALGTRLSKESADTLEPQVVSTSVARVRSWLLAANCGSCGADGVQLWRPAHATPYRPDDNLCGHCGAREHKGDISPYRIGPLLPLIIDPEDGKPWAWTLVPDEALAAWNELPEFPKKHDEKEI